MSSKQRMPEMKEGGVNVTPLIDIVMCLIIFFMLVAKIGVSRGIDKHIKLPDASGLPIKEMGQTLTLNLHHLGHKPQITALLNKNGIEDVVELSLDHVQVGERVAAAGIPDTAYEVHDAFAK